VIWFIIPVKNDACVGSVSLNDRLSMELCRSHTVLITCKSIAYLLLTTTPVHDNAGHRAGQRDMPLHWVVRSHRIVISGAGYPRNTAHHHAGQSRYCFVGVCSVYVYVCVCLSIRTKLKKTTDQKLLLVVVV